MLSVFAAAVEGLHLFLIICPVLISMSPSLSSSFWSSLLSPDPSRSLSPLSDEEEDWDLWRLRRERRLRLDSEEEEAAEER